MNCQFIVLLLCKQFSPPLPLRCRWFTEWDANVQEAHKRGQIAVVFYFRGHLAKHGADGSRSRSDVEIDTDGEDQLSTGERERSLPFGGRSDRQLLQLPHVEGELLWEQLAGAARTGNLWDDDSGLGGSQRGEVAWLKKCGIPFVRLDVSDGAPGAGDIVPLHLAGCAAACAALERELPGESRTAPMTLSRCRTQRGDLPLHSISTPWPSPIFAFKKIQQVVPVAWVV